MIPSEKSVVQKCLSDSSISCKAATEIAYEAHLSSRAKNFSSKSS